MRKKFEILFIGLLSLMILVTIPIIHFEKGDMVNNGNLITIVTNLFKGVKTEYLKGLVSKAGFHNYAVVFEAYDAGTGEFLTSAADFRN